MRFKEEPDDPCEIQMAQMIDCVFLLLLYFISCAQIKVEEKYLGLMIPGTAATPDRCCVTFSSTRRLRISCNTTSARASSPGL